MRKEGEIEERINGREAKIFTPRGIRNNNPGNIRGSSIRWVGQIGFDELGFCRFSNSTLGIRAIAKLLFTYQDKYKLDTIEKIIARYAPSSENDTSAYADHVAKIAGIKKDTKISLELPENKVLMTKIIVGIILHENGRQPYVLEEIEEAIRLATGL